MRWGNESLEYTCDALNGLTEFYINSDLTETYSFDSQGRLDGKGGNAYAYGDNNHVHAATSMGDNSYTYDENGNMVIRSLVSGPVTGTYTLTHNADNRLVGVTGPDSTITYTYNGDFAQVIAVMEGSEAVTKTIYIGSYYEYQIVETLTSTVATTRTYYFAGSTRVAMRDNSTLIFLLSDHLGSTSLTTDASGGVLSVQKYMPYGEVRGVGGLETDYTYTGQRALIGLGLLHYQARMYDPSIARFIEADSLIPRPKEVLSWDRYQYVESNPIRYHDPTGHDRDCVIGDYDCRVLVNHEQFDEAQLNVLAINSKWDFCLDKSCPDLDREFRREYREPIQEVMKIQKHQQGLENRPRMVITCDGCAYPALGIAVDLLGIAADIELLTIKEPFFTKIASEVEVGYFVLGGLSGNVDIYDAQLYADQRIADANSPIPGVGLPYSIWGIFLNIKDISQRLKLNVE